MVGNYENDILLNGKIVYPNSEIYQGECNEDGIQIGKGMMKYNNGEIFIGNWKNNKKNGKGLLCFEINDMDLFNKNFDIIKNNIVKIFELDFGNNFYYGDFVNDIMDGKGILFMKKNENNMKDLIYEGDFKNNKKHGKGVIYFNKNLFSEIYMENDIIISQKKKERNCENCEDKLILSEQKISKNKQFLGNIMKLPLEKITIR